MIKDVFNALGSATRKLFHSWLTLVILLVLYLAMIGSVYLFFSTREATVAQLLSTFALCVLAPMLWLVIQGTAVRYVSEHRPTRILARSFVDCWKLAIIVLPLVLLIVVIVHYLGGIEFKSMQETVRSVAAPWRLPPPRVPAVRSTPWQAVALSTLQYLLMLLVLPLGSIHLWIDTARNGLKNALKRFPRTAAYAFAPRSVLTYAIGFVVFAVIPYFLIVTRTPVASPWLDVSLFGARLALAVLLSLIGWVVTVAALTKLSTSETLGAEQPDKKRFNQGPEHVPAES